MKRNITLGSLALLMVGVLVFVVVSWSSSTKLFARSIFTGYNQVFPVNNGRFVVYTGHNFINYSPDSDEVKIISPDTGSKLNNISVSSDGTSATAFVSYVSNSDILETQYGVQDNGWVQFNFSDGSVKPFDINSDSVFALNNLRIVALITDEEDNTTSAISRFMIIGESGVEKYSTYTEVPTQVREFNDGLVVISNGVTRSSVYRIKKDITELIAYTSIRTAISLDGSYYYSIDNKGKESGLVDQETLLSVHQTETGKLESTAKLSAGVTVHWGSSNSLALSNVAESTVSVVSYPENKQKTYNISDGLSGVSLPTNNGVLITTGSSISLATEIKEKININADIIKEEESDTTYSIHKTGSMVLVSAHNLSNPEIIKSIKANVGDLYPRIGFVFNHAQPSVLDSN